MLVFNQSFSICSERNKYLQRKRFCSLARDAAECDQQHIAYTTVRTLIAQIHLARALHIMAPATFHQYILSYTIYVCREDQLQPESVLPQLPYN